MHLYYFNFFLEMQKKISKKKLRDYIYFGILSLFIDSSSTSLECKLTFKVNFRDQRTLLTQNDTIY